MKFPKIKKKKKDTGIKSLKLETDISKLLNILQKKFGKSKGGIVEILKLAAGGFPRKIGMIKSGLIRSILSLMIIKLFFINFYNSCQ